MSGVQMNGPYRPLQTRLWFGHIGHLFPEDWIELPNGELQGVVETNIDVLVDHVRWSSDVPLGEPL